MLRLLPPGHEGKLVATRNPEGDRLRSQLYRLIMGRFAAGYDAGYRDASAGKPPSAAYCEQAWDKLVEREGGGAEARRAGLESPRIHYSRPPAHLVPEGAELSDPRERQRT